ncbi:MAG: mannose-1-phosphate guanylyltransferase, partial [Candidatus Kryptoniota bacterium]
EKASNVLTIPSNFIWSDVGSWDEVYRLSDKDQQGNTFVGDVISFESSNNFVMGNQHLIALVGINDIVVVETEDALLICRRGRSQSVKEIVDILRKQNRQDLV